MNAQTEVGERAPAGAEAYTFGPQLGVGGMGVVFAGQEVNTGRKVAIKLMRGEVGGVTGEQRFMREVHALAGLQHPAIVEYIDHGVTGDGHAFLVMESLEGEDLQARLQRGPLAIEECVDLGLRLADALAAAHARGVVHRDLKPSNIYLPGGAIADAKLLDFGVARVSDDPYSLTRTGAIIGTVGYMAPEQARGEPDVDGRADLYSLGCVLHECLTGAPVFSGGHAMAILAKILLDDPPRVSSLRPDVPEPFASVIARLLAKDREARPREAMDLVALLANLVSELAADAGADQAGPGTGLTLREQRILCLLLVRHRSLAVDALGATSTGAQGIIEQIGGIVAGFGAVFSPMLGGVGLVCVQLDAPATDVTAQAARCSLALARHFPAIAQVLVTGRGQRHAGSFVGWVIDEAMRIASHARDGAILIDDVTVGLLDDRFVVDRRDGGIFLERECEAMTSRMLLGQPAPFVGRARELGLLTGLVHEAVDESRSFAALVTAGPGCGKSRLRHELTRVVHADGVEALVLFGRAAPMTRGAALGVLRTALRREVELGDDDSPDQQRARLARRVAETAAPKDCSRVVAFLGEICGVPFPDAYHPALSLARRDAVVMSDAMRVAWLDWLRSVCQRRPTLLILEDLHWGDTATIAFVEAALHDLAELPFIVLALARPEVHELFPRMWLGCRLTTIALSPLSARASEALTRQVLGAAIDDAQVQALVAQADGNPFFLEELIRAAASGVTGELPDTVLGIIQARLQAIDDESRRVLRAASVFGGGFSEAAVVTVLAQPIELVRARLAALVQQELLTRERRPGILSYRFRHALVRDASYAMLTDDDRTLAHRLAATWLAGQEGYEPIAVAEHFLRASLPGDALGWYQRAAEQALEGGDLGTAVERADQAITCGAVGEQLAQLRLLQAEARVWSGSLEDAERGAVAAIAWLRPGTMGWYTAIQKIIYCMSVRGAVDEALAWLSQAEAQPPELECAEGPLICLCESIFAIYVAGRHELMAPVQNRLDQRASGTVISPAYLGQVQRAYALAFSFRGETESAAQVARLAALQFSAAGDLRNAGRINVFAAHCYFLLGAYDQAEQLLRETEKVASRLGAEQVLIYCQGTLAWVLTYHGRVAEAREIYEALLPLCERRRDRRATGAFSISFGLMEGLSGHPARAEALIFEALLAVRGQRQLEVWGRAVLARVYLANGRGDEAAALATDVMNTMVGLEIAINYEVFVVLALVESLEADAQARPKALAMGLASLRRQLSRITNPALRGSFLAIPECVALIEIGQQAGHAVDDLVGPRRPA